MGTSHHHSGPVPTGARPGSAWRSNTGMGGKRGSMESAWGVEEGASEMRSGCARVRVWDRCHVCSQARGSALLRGRPHIPKIHATPGVTMSAKRPAEDSTESTGPPPPGSNPLGTTGAPDGNATSSQVDDDTKDATLPRIPKRAKHIVRLAADGPQLARTVQSVSQSARSLMAGTSAVAATEALMRDMAEEAQKTSSADEFLGVITEALLEHSRKDHSAARGPHPDADAKAGADDAGSTPPRVSPDVDTTTATAAAAAPSPPPPPSTASDAPRAVGSFDALIGCSVCYNVMDAMIYQCSRGHTICQTCFATMRAKHIETHSPRAACPSGCPGTRCPTCRTSMRSATRCLVLEKLRDTEAIRCRMVGCDAICAGIAKWHEHMGVCKLNVATCPFSGCAETLHAGKLDAHTRECEFRRVICPFTQLDPVQSSCRETMHPRDVLAHLREHHDAVPIVTASGKVQPINLRIAPTDMVTGARWTHFFAIETGELFVFRATITVNATTADQQRATDSHGRESLELSGHLTACVRSVGNTQRRVALSLTARSNGALHQISYSGVAHPTDSGVPTDHHMANMCVSLGCLPKYIFMNGDSPYVQFHMNISSSVEDTKRAAAAF